MTENSAADVAADAAALDARANIFAELYRELHDLARRALRREGKHLSISTTKRRATLCILSPITGM